MSEKGLSVNITPRHRLLKIIENKEEEIKELELNIRDARISRKAIQECFDLLNNEKPSTDDGPQGDFGLDTTKEAIKILESE